MNSPHIIQINNLNFNFGKHPVLQNVSLQVPYNSIFGFLGPNGAGKTTTIKTIMGLLRIKDNSIFVFGKDINKHRIEILSNASAIVEVPSLYDHLTAIENLKITCLLRNIDYKRINNVLDSVNLTNDASRKIRQFSTGMKQRLSLASALLSQPELLILDEPINGLDPKGIIEIRNLLFDLNKIYGTTIFISSHILSEIERICSHIGIINNGKIVFHGSMDTLIKQRNKVQQVIIETSEIQSAFNLLQNKFIVKNDNNFLILQYNSKQDIANALEIITTHHIPVYSVQPIANSLEDSFLHYLNID
ncbi:MAG: ATP-binding cassette domain-containing protein [Lentimicrobiaceae bacterium]|nr:ATP-binding cassette domain-containing protein [Lentimicrobiaceae bacterium]